MSNPRQVIPGSTHLITRRTSGRKYMLKPTPLSAQVFCYCLAHAARVYNMKIHAYCLMSNHYHIVATDPEGKMPAFMSWLNEFIAKAMNKTWDRWEYFWAPGTYSAVRLETLDDVIDKILYTLANPVKAFLVTKSANWPGANSRTKPYGCPKTYARPPIFFRKKGPMPDNETLTLELPPGFQGSEQDFKTFLNKLLAEREDELLSNARQQKRSFLGASAAVAVSHNDRPEKPAQRKNLNPQVASKNKDALINALIRLKSFRNDYIAARKRFDAGESDVVFPFGTYALQKLVNVQPIPPPYLSC